MALQLEHILPPPVKNQDITNVHSVLMLSNGTDFEVHGGWKVTYSLFRRSFSNHDKMLKSLMCTLEGIGCNRIQVKFECNWDFNCLSYLYNLTQYSNRGPQLLQRMAFAHQKRNDVHHFTSYCHISYICSRRGNDKISLSHLFTDWGRLGHGASCWASHAHSYRARSQSGDIHSTD